MTHLNMIPFLVAFAFLAQTMGSPVARDLTSGSASTANPFFQTSTTSKGLYKFATDVGNATKSELTTLEYLSAYDTDLDGQLWLVYNSTHAVAQFTPEYRDSLGIEGEAGSTQKIHTFSEYHFQQLLALIRDNSQLREEAEEWESSITTTHNRHEAPNLISRAQLAGICGPARCQSQRSCLRFGGARCKVCLRFACYH